MDADVERLAFNDGLTATSTTDLLAGLKNLAVTELHPSVHVMALHEMRQARGESAKAFSARVKGIATNCILVKKYTKNSCDEQVSFLEETCYHVVLSGLQDTALREKVLTQAMLNNVTDLPSLITYTSAEESAKLTKSTPQVAATQRTPPRHRPSCTHCGEPKHGENNELRQEKCKAFGKVCQRCQKPNHFASQCRSTKNTPAQPRTQISEITEDENDPEVSGFICHMNAEVTTPYNAAPHIAAMKNTVKTVLDNWHGYHSVPIHPDDRHLTTFITPYGRYRYRTAPQGFVSAGDAYTQRMDIIVEGTPNFDHCVDDSILWDKSIREHFFRVCEFIEKCSLAGCVFNPDKFQDEVDYLGFTITMKGVKPTSKFVQSIRDFPEPKCLTDVRSWFGLINQVSYSFAVAPQMAPFRALLSSKIPFHWSAELSTAFNMSKAEIIDQCTNGVRNFRPNAPTALATDWSKAAVGLWLTQKYCECQSLIPGCCKEGWQTVLVASKFNQPAVSRYHSIEGEAYAAAWALDKCKLFVLGYPNLTLVTDHKPLLAILGHEQELSDLINPRLMNFKLKFAAFRFTPVFVPGKLHVVPDSMSRRNDSPVHDQPKLPTLPPVDNNVLPEYSDTFGPPTWVVPPQGSALCMQTELTYIGQVSAKLETLQQEPRICAAI